LKELMIAGMPIAAVSIVAHAHYIGRGALPESVTVEQLRASERGDQRCLLGGLLTSFLDADNNRWPASQVVEHSTTVELAGKYDKASINVSTMMVRDVRIAQTVAQ
jgi:hypothetical protein